uniref:F-box domain-containing protein n=1 Tax=Mycena chlorophos TaxID=658473 RepID=A0ABQ0LU02_MYCCL|nr:predicted protein [Mycena chlorophos]
MAAATAPIRGGFSSPHLAKESNPLIWALRSGYRPPTPAAVEQFTNVLTSISTDLARYKRDALTSSLAESRRLQSEHNRLLLVYRIYGSIFAPIHKLPPELLLEIFQWIQAAETTQGPALGPYGTPLPMWQNSIGGVCYRWHQFLASESRFWTVFQARAIRPALIPYAAHVVSRCLSRSGTRSLRFSVEVCHERAAHERILEPLLRNAERWQDATLFLTSLPRDLAQLANLKNRVPRLVSLDIRYGFQGLETLDAFENAPMLHNVSCDLYMPRLPWRQLRRVKFLFQFLDNVPSLRFLSQVSRDCQVEIVAAGMPAIDRPNPGLTSPLPVFDSGILSLRLTFPILHIPVHTFFTLFRCPDLRTLALQGPPRKRNWSRLGIQTLLRRSPMLVTLTLWKVHITDGELLACLRATPLLEELFCQDNCVHARQAIVEARPSPPPREEVTPAHKPLQRYDDSSSSDVSPFLGLAWVFYLQPAHASTIVPPSEHIFLWDEPIPPNMAVRRPLMPSLPHRPASPPPRVELAADVDQSRLFGAPRAGHPLPSLYPVFRPSGTGIFKPVPRHITRPKKPNRPAEDRTVLTPALLRKLAPRHRADESKHVLVPHLRTFAVASFFKAKKPERLDEALCEFVRSRARTHDAERERRFKLQLTVLVDHSLTADTKEEYVEAKESKLREVLGVEIVREGVQGRLRVEFVDEDDLQTMWDEERMWG